MDLHKRGEGETIDQIPNQKKAVHGDMNRPLGRGIELLLEALLQGDSNIQYHYVVCQAFFYFFWKKIIVYLQYMT